MSRRIKIGVIRGGPSAEHDVSLATGAAVLAAIRTKLDEHYEAVDVIIDTNGMWSIDDQPVTPTQAFRYFDIAWNALHGTFGEDGKIQTLFESHGIPFTGSGSLSSAIGMNKVLTKRALKDAGIKSPYSKEILSANVRKNVHFETDALFTSFLFPAVIKPATSGSSVGVSIVRTKEDIPAALLAAAQHGDVVLVEEYIQGDEATCGVIDNFRGQKTYALPPIEIKPAHDFFDFHAKYSGQSEEIVPARFSSAIKAELEELAKRVHTLLGLRHFSRTDFMIHPRRGVYVLEVNTLPGMTEQSLIPKALRAVGSDLHELVHHIVQLEMGE
ncbi:MAG TPA: D-alanine--D-alanine ligase [Candidatus Paceibacterota bacterium]